MGVALIGLLGALTGAGIAELSAWLRDRRAYRHTQRAELTKAIVSLIGALQEASALAEVAHMNLDEARFRVVLREARVAAALAYAGNPPETLRGPLDFATRALERAHDRPSSAWDSLGSSADQLWAALMKEVRTRDT
jgi:hypothetical protein